MTVASPGIVKQPTWKLYYELTKPRVVALIVFTAIVGTLLASPGWPPFAALVYGNIGIALAAASAAAINASAFACASRRATAAVRRCRNRWCTLRS